jgi:hypothetical protein
MGCGLVCAYDSHHVAVGVGDVAARGEVENGQRVGDGRDPSDEKTCGLIENSRRGPGYLMLLRESDLLSAAALSSPGYRPFSSRMRLGDSS